MTDPVRESDGYYHPASEDEVAALIRMAGEKGLQLRVRGALHSVPAAIAADRFNGAGDPGPQRSGWGCCCWLSCCVGKRLVQVVIAAAVEPVEDADGGSRPVQGLLLIGVGVGDDPRDHELCLRPGGCLARLGLEFLVFRGGHFRFGQGQRCLFLQDEVGGKQFRHYGQGAGGPGAVGSEVACGVG